MDDEIPTLSRILAEELVGHLILSRTYYPAYAAGLPLTGQEKVIEFGSGGGLLSRPLAGILIPEGSLTCVDRSLYWTDKARRRLGDTPGVTILCGDIGVLDLRENSADMVVIHFSLHEVDGRDRIDVVAALVNALRPEGILVIREPSGPRHGMQIGEIRTLMRDAGLREQHAACSRSWWKGAICDGLFIKSW